MTSPCIISIDPGLKGAIAVLEIATQSVKALHCMPCKKVTKDKGKKTVTDDDTLTSLLHSLLASYPVGNVVLEGQRIQAGQGLGSSGVTMFRFGWLAGFAASCKVPVTIVAANTWQTIYPKEIKKDPSLDPKAKSALYCRWLYPTLSLTATARSRVISDGKTDAVLLGVWYCRSLSKP